MQDEEDTLALAARWVYFYNVQRPRLGEGMDKQTPLEVLHRLGYNGSDQIALFPSLLLGTISTYLVLACDPEGVNDLLTYYRIRQNSNSMLQFYRP